MREDRCPWCGKRINRFRDQQNVQKKKTPANLRFARCSHCGNYYGQNVYSVRNKLCFAGGILTLLAGLLSGIYYILFLSIPFVLLVVTSPIVKMTENEDVVTNKDETDR